jgi:hypothetical protein
VSFLDLLTQHSTAIWGAVSGVVTGIGMFLVSLRQVNVVLEKARLRMTLEASATETAERAAFRTTLMTELNDLRGMIKECESDKDGLRSRLSNTEAQILVLKASNEIMEKWVAFFRDGTSLTGGPAATTNADSSKTLPKL